MIRRPLLTLLLATVTLGTLVGPADASVFRTDAEGNSSYGYDDSKGDAPRAADVTATYAYTDSKKKYVFEVDGREFIKNETDFLRLFIDTNEANSGPEYTLNVVIGRNPDAPVGFTRLFRVDSWDLDGRTVPCSISKRVNYNKDYITVGVPRSCLKNAPGVDWAGIVGTIDRASGGTIYGDFDYFPGKRRFYGGGLVY